MPVHIFRSSDTGLPAAGITGVVGSTITNLWDPCLVNGYNTQASVSASRTGTVVTYTKAAHGFSNSKGTVLTITGFSEANFNRTGTISNHTTDTFDMTCANSGATSEGANGTAIRASLGWAKTTGTTNQASYRAATGNRYYFAVDDNTAARENRLRLFETITTGGPAAGNGTNPTPSDAQLSGGLYLHKSSTADSTLRSWVLVSNGVIFYLLTRFSSVDTTGTGCIFGDFTSYKSSDAYNTIIIGDIAANAQTTSVRISNCNTTSAVLSGHYVPRAYAQTGTSLQVGKMGNPAFTAAATELGAGGYTYPLPMNSGIMITPIWIHELTSGLRGHLPGLWNVCHARPLSSGDTFSGAASTPLAGKTFEVFNVGSAAQICFETSDTWDL